MARKAKSEIDQLREELIRLQNLNSSLANEIANTKKLELKICVETSERLIWLCQNQDNITWMLKLDFDEERGIIAPYFDFVDETDETVYNVRFYNSILEQALTM